MANCNTCVKQDLRCVDDFGESGKGCYVDQIPSECKSHAVNFAFVPEKVSDLERFTWENTVKSLRDAQETSK